MLKLARNLGALAVCGNHEVASLRAWKAEAEGAQPDRGYEWTKELSADDWAFVRKMPFTISIPQHNSILVHAGLVPEVPIQEQNPLDMVAMRNLIASTNSCGRASFVALERDTPGAVAWASIWPGPVHVYFGHDAKRRLQQHAFATGLDTGCLYGGQLTAVILHPRSRPRLEHVDARSQYVVPKPRPAHSGGLAAAWRALSRGWTLGPGAAPLAAAAAAAALVAAGVGAACRWGPGGGRP